MFEREDDENRKELIKSISIKDYQTPLAPYPYRDPVNIKVKT